MRRRGLALAIVLAAVAAPRARGAQPPSVHVLGSLMPEEELEPIATTALRENSHLRAEVSRLKKELDEYNANCALDVRTNKLSQQIERSGRERIEPPHQFPTFVDRSAKRVAKRFEDIVKSRVGEGHSTHRRKILATHSPSAAPSASAVPTTFTPVPTTQSPSTVPSASPAPTTEGVTTHAQLANAADAACCGSEIVVEADVLFPSSQAPITLDTARSVSVVGRSAIAGDRVTLDGGGASRLFVVTGGAVLHLAFLNLANGTAPETTVDCVPGGNCVGGAILVHGGTLIMRACEIRGGNHPISSYYGNAFVGTGISFSGLGTFGTLHNITFKNLVGAYGTAMIMEGPGAEITVDLFGCVFLDNIATGAGIIEVLLTGGGYTNLYDCVFERNRGGAFWTIVAPTTITRTKFYDNIGIETPTWKAGGVVVNYASDLWITDSVFERNIGGDALDGGAMTCIVGGETTLKNVSFIANRGYQGGAISVQSASKLTMTACYGQANEAEQRAAVFVVDSAELVVINSTFEESVGEWDAFGMFNGCTLSMLNVVIRDMTVLNSNVMTCGQESVCTFTDSLITGLRSIGGDASVMLVSNSNSVLLRTTVTNNHALYSPGCFVTSAGSTLTIEDSEITDCQASEVLNDREGGVVSVFSGTVTIKNSRISLSDGGGRGGVAKVAQGGSLRIVGGTITDTSDGEFAIFVVSDTDFALQLDSVAVDETVDIYSRGDALIQNCVGFGSAAGGNASIASCAATNDYCLREACADVAIGTDCICEVAGEQIAFPTDCMQVGNTTPSAVGGVK